MKKIIKKIFIFIIIIIFIMAFSHSYSSLNIDNLAYVIALGIDLADNGKIQVTFQFSTPVSIESGDNPTPIINSVTSASISNAISILNNYLGTPISMSHCKAIIFSEQIAIRGISNEIYTLINDTQVTPSSNIIISKCTAKSYLEQTSPELKKLVSKYYETFTNSSNYTGYIPDATIGDFFNDLSSKTSEPYAILGGINTGSENQDVFSLPANSLIQGGNGVKNLGIAVFSKDKLIGELNALESVAFLNIRNSIDRFLITVQDPENENSFLDIYLSPAKKTKISVDTSSQTPYIKVDCEFTGRIYSVSENSNYLSPNILNSISESCNNYLESLFSTYLYKTSKELNSDINSFGTYSLKNFLTTKDFEDYYWLENYKNAFFKVNINTSVKSAMLITET